MDGVEEDVHERFEGSIIQANAARNTTRIILIPLSQVQQDSFSMEDARPRVGGLHMH